MIFLASIWLIAIGFCLFAALWKWRLVSMPFSFATAGLAVVIIGSVFGYDFFSIDSGPIPITIDRVLLGVLLLLFAGLWLRRRVSIQMLDSTDFAIAALLVVLLLSTFTTQWNFAENRPLSRLVFFYLLPISLYFVVRHCRITELDLKVVATGLSLFCLYLGITAIFEYRGWYGLVFPSYIRDPSYIEFLGRGRGPFLNPVSNGIFLTTGLAAATVLWWHSRWKARVLLTAAIPVIGVGALATLTRSVWLGAAAGIGSVVWLPASRRQRAAMIVAGTLTGLIVVSALGSSLASFKRDKHVTAAEMSQSAQLRPIFAKVAWEMFKERPLLGCGFGQYGRDRLDHITHPGTGYELRKAASYLQHNVLLSFLTETGLVGCLVLCVVLLRSGQIGWRLWRRKDATSWQRSYGLIVIAWLAAFLINGMFHDVSIIPMGNTLMFYLLGIVANLYSATANSELVPVPFLRESATNPLQSNRAA